MIKHLYWQTAKPYAKRTGYMVLLQSYCNAKLSMCFYKQQTKFLNQNMSFLSGSDNKFC